MRRVVRRVAVDIGSGLLKLEAMDVCAKGSRRMLPLPPDVSSVPLRLMAHVTATGFEPSVVDRLRQTLRLVVDHARCAPAADGTEIGAVDIQAVATQAFREAANGLEVARDLEASLDMSLQVLTQDEESDLGFRSAVCAADERERAAQTVVWDLGGGSFQLSAEDADGGVVAVTSDLGLFRMVQGFVAVTGREFDLQEQGGSSVLYPTSASEVAAYRDWVRGQLARAGGTCSTDYLRARIAQPGADVLAVAGAHLIFPTVSSEPRVSRKTLLAAIDRRVGVPCDELLQEDPVLRSCADAMPVQPWQFLPPLVYADEIMALLGIESVRLVGATLARGVLMNDSRWAHRESAAAQRDARRSLAMAH